MGLRESEQAADGLDELRRRCAGYQEAPLGELQRAAALVDAAHQWFAREAAEKPPGERVFAVLPRSTREAVTVEQVAAAADVAASTARRHLEALVDAGRARSLWKDRRRATLYYRNPLACERTTKNGGRAC